MARKFQPQMATGNDLLEGDVVYFTSTGEWSREIGDAALAVNPEAAEDLLKRASAFPNQVVGVYLVEFGDRRPGPRGARRISARSSGPAGPSNYPQHGRQAERSDV